MPIQWATPLLDGEEEKEIIDSLRANWISMGPKVKAFEAFFSKFIGVKHAIAVSSGTAALDVALKALKVAPGDEVIVPALTYIATVNAVMYQHARPVLVDVSMDDINLDADKIQEKITKRTKVIMPIDYGGNSADYAKLEKLAKDSGAFLLEDGAHSIGGTFNGKSLCSFGSMATASFHTAKVITSVEGGMVFTDSDDLGTLSRIIRNQGEDPAKKYFHPIVGHNYRMSDIHAGVGLAQTRKLDRILSARANVAEMYNKRLGHMDGIVLPKVRKGCKCAWFLYPVMFKTKEVRDKIVDSLKKGGVETRICWPYPIHTQGAYQGLFKGEKYPNSEYIADRNVTLPMHPGLTEKDVDYIANIIDGII